MKEIKYSVIIPAYNAEKTLRRCLESLLAQNRTDVEILLISDGSTDGTDAIAQSHGEKIRFFRQNHAGVSAARNLGLQLAAGTYVTFVDSDDFVSADYFSALDPEPDCDLLVFGAGDCAGGDPLRKLLATRKIMPPWNKRIRRGFIEEKQLRFVEGLETGEDFCFCMTCALAAETIAVSAADIYRADISNEKSLSRRYRPGLDKTMVWVFSYIAALDGAAAYGDILDSLYVKQAVSCIAEEYKQGTPSRCRVREICGRFHAPIGKPTGLLHRGIRWLLAHSCLLTWLGAYLLKGREFEKCRKQKCCSCRVP